MVPLFSANLDFFRVTVPRTSPVTPEIQEWAASVSGGQELSRPQVAALAVAKAGHTIDSAFLRRLGLSSGDARRSLGDLVDLGLLVPRKARDSGSYRLSPSLPDTPATPAGNSVRDRVLAALASGEPSTRDQLQQAAEASRSGVTKALDSLIADDLVEATAPPRSPNRRYRIKQ